MHKVEKNARRLEDVKGCLERAMKDAETARLHWVFFFLFYFFVGLEIIIV